MPHINSAATAWMLIATILVFAMTIPGITLFYAGLVHRKNVVSVLTLGFFIAAMMTILWVVFGFSLTFGTGYGNFFSQFIGDFRHSFLWGDIKPLTDDQYPGLLFVAFQMGFAIVAPALMIGGVAERMKFRAILFFIILWEILVYYPICHSLWSTTGWLHQLGVLDYAGGIVVHVNAGFGALVLAIMLGRRAHLKTDQRFYAHNLTAVFTGTALLWIGWFGFNGGNAGMPNAEAARALLNTQIAAAASGLSWAFMEWKVLGRPSPVGLACGIISGLVAITSGAGIFGPLGALIIGLLAGAICFYASRIKHFLRFDDSLDAFAVHGAGGFLGAILVPIFALSIFGGDPLHPANGDLLHQLLIQGLGILVTLAWTSIVTFVILIVLRRTIGIKPTEKSAMTGMDMSTYGEEGYRL